MKLYTFEHQGQTLVGAQKEGKLVNLSKLLGVKNMIDLIERFDDLDPNKAVENATELIDFDDITIKIPVQPQTVWCSGLNYKSHVLENPNAKFLSEPRFFAKLPNTLIGPNEPILHPGEQFLVDYEVEFAVVFGKKASRLSETNAMNHVFGYTILHDVGARYIQFKDNNEMMGKNFDTFCPIGPCIVTKDEIPNPELVKLSSKINGQIMQDGCNDEWLFTLPHLLSWLTMACTLQPGDIVSTGTPMGIGFFRNPQVFLKPGDVVSLEIPEIGILSNPVVADEYILV
jgi:2,4-didehydro-3-deoxy-L-rhamnonate hydrolase